MGAGGGSETEQTMFKAHSVEGAACMCFVDLEITAPGVSGGTVGICVDRSLQSHLGFERQEGLGWRGA